MDKIKTGIIGCGKVAQIHAAALTNILESEFTAVYSRSQEKADAFGAQHGVKGYADLDTFLAESGVQAVLIATPHPFLPAPTLGAAQHGVHVMIEKPLASSLQDCDAMIAAMRRANLKLAMISQRRCYEPVMRVKQAIDDGKIGTPVLGTVTMLGWRDENYYQSDPWRGTWKEEGGGVLVNQAPHQLDILQWYMGPIDELYGCWGNLNHPYIEVEDTAAAVIRFRNGGLGNVLVSNAQNPALYGKVHVHGSNGASVGVQTDGGAMFVAGMSTIEEPPVNDLWTVPGETDMLDRWVEEDSARFKQIDATKHYHEIQIRDFLQTVIDDREPMVPGEEGRKTVEIFTAIYRSNRDSKPIKFPLQPEAGRDDYDGRYV
ncbi:MAG: Gfo/Idh/MocA family protein [Planctomycetota bacterium]|jgi:predicted dehydrogenase